MFIESGTYFVSFEYCCEYKRIKKSRWLDLVCEKVT
jgi:hypothetical protein